MGSWASLLFDAFTDEHKCTFDLSSPNCIGTILHHWIKNEKNLYIPVVIKQEIEKYTHTNPLVRTNAVEIKGLQTFKNLVISINSDLYYEMKKKYVYDLSLEEIHFNDYRLGRKSYDVEYVINNSSVSLANTECIEKKLTIGLKLLFGLSSYFEETALIVYILDRYSEDSFFAMKRKIEEINEWKMDNQSFEYRPNTNTISILCEPLENTNTTGIEFCDEFIKLYCTENDINYAGFVDFNSQLSISNMVECYVFKYLKRVTNHCKRCNRLFVN